MRLLAKERSISIFRRSIAPFICPQSKNCPKWCIENFKAYLIPSILGKLQKHGNFRLMFNPGLEVSAAEAEERRLQ